MIALPPPPPPMVKVFQSMMVRGAESVMLAVETALPPFPATLTV